MRFGRQDTRKRRKVTVGRHRTAGMVVCERVSRQIKPEAGVRRKEKPLGQMTNMIKHLDGKIKHSRDLQYVSSVTDI